jgi:hypothetical protein
MLAAICKMCMLLLQGFVADNILGGFNLNYKPTVKANAFPVHTVAPGFFLVHKMHQVTMLPMLPETKAMKPLCSLWCLTLQWYLMTLM